MATRLPTREDNRDQNLGFYKVANPSNKTIAERNKFSAQLDDFATFSWANINMFAEFGAFIINEKKGSLKLYNGPNFKNTYSQPQFQDGYTNLTGVTFNTQTISFTIGVYWISIEDYRVLMNALHPYEVNMLTFSFEKTYGYFCKLQSVKDSTRYIIGQEANQQNTSNNLNNSVLASNTGTLGVTTGPRYYTELNLTFEVIGAQCAKEIEPQHLITGTDDQYIRWENDTAGTTITITIPSNRFISDLDYPFDLILPVVYLSSADQQGMISATAVLKYTYTENGVTDQVTNTSPLFNLTLKNVVSDAPVSLRYNSEHGLIYWQIGNQSKVLTLLSTQLNGQRILSAINTNDFFWPGRLNFSAVTDCTVEIYIQADPTINFWIATADPDHPGQYIYVLQCEYVAQRRTNVI